MKKLWIVLALFCCILSVNTLTNFTYAQDNQNLYIVTANYANVYEEADLTSQKLATLNHKTEIVLEMENETAKLYMTDTYTFHKIMGSGYILADLVCKKNEVLVTIPNFNAQTNNDCKVYIKQDNQLLESEITLNKGERIFLYEGFDSKLEYTAISYVHNNEVLFGYLQTENIRPDGINPVIIYCIIVILAVLGIIFAWLFMKNKKVKLKKKNLA